MLEAASGGGVLQPSAASCRSARAGPAAVHTLVFVRAQRISRSSHLRRYVAPDVDTGPAINELNPNEYVTAHGFVYTDGVFKDVSAGTSGNPPVSQAHAINNLEQAVGVVGNSAFRYENGTMTAIALLFGLSNAFGINNLGQATGWVIQACTHRSRDETHR